MVLGFNVDGGASGTGLSCGLWREAQVALGFHVEGEAGGTKLSCGGRGSGTWLSCGLWGRCH